MTALSATGLLAADEQVVTLSCLGMGGVAIQLHDASGDLNGTVTFEGSVNGVAFASILVGSVAGGDATSTATGAGIWYANCTGLHSVRARMSTYNAGSIRASLNAVESAPGVPYLTEPE